MCRQVLWFSRSLLSIGGFFRVKSKWRLVMFVRGFAALALALFALSAPLTPTAHATAQEALLLTRQEARALALESGPRFLAAGAMAESARGVARTDRIYPFNPTAEIKGVEALDPGGWGNYEAVLSQEIEWAGQWLVRRDAGTHAMEAARQDETEALRSLLLDLDRAFFQLRVAEERFRVSQEGAGLAQNLRAAVQVQLREGQISVLEMNLANIEAGRSEARALAARNELKRAQQELRNRLGLEPTSLVGTRETATEVTSLGSSDPSALVEMALERRPDVQAARAREQEARARRRLAGREAIPNVDLGAVARRTAADTDPTYGLRITFPIPLWNRNQGQREQFQALEELRQVERREIELRVEGEVLTAFDAFETATEELDLFTASVLLPAQENRELLQQAYQAGSLDLPTTLLLQAQLVDSELAYWDSWLRQREALALAEAAIGSVPKPVTSG
jgi:cobalt-zinc-cadmium efflux system outer membrane protein